MTAEAGMQLAQNLGTLTRLTHLYFYDNEPLRDLEQLTALCQLHTLHLHNWAQGPHRGQHLTHLQELYIHDIYVTELDLSSCTQLLDFNLTFDQRRQQVQASQALQRRVLPFGPDVHLKNLVVYSTQIQRPFVSVLVNLSQAQSIASIAFVKAFPENLREGDWPCDLPQFHSGFFSDSKSTLPQQFLGYTHLNNLHWDSCAPSELPNWFSGLTQLTSLHMDDCTFASFPAVVLSLFQLRSLTIRNFPVMTITTDILQIAAWRCLGDLDLSVMDPVGNQSYSLDSQLYLLELCQCLVARGDSGNDIDMHELG